METVDANGGARPLGQAGYAITGSGGGGEGGRYVFTRLEELSAVIDDWKALYKRIRDRAENLEQAISLIRPPADDMMSWLQADAAVASLRKAQEHRKAMENYAADYVAKLEAARAEYAAADADGAAAVRRAGGE